MKSKKKIALLLLFTFALIYLLYIIFINNIFIDVQKDLFIEWDINEFKDLNSINSWNFN